MYRLAKMHSCTHTHTAQHHRRTDRQIRQTTVPCQQTNTTG